MIRSTYDLPLHLAKEKEKKGMKEISPGRSKLERVICSSNYSFDLTSTTRYHQTNNLQYNPTSIDGPIQSDIDSNQTNVQI